MSVIALWSPPRSVSTAFTRMMMERGDLVVLHEPISNLLSTGEFELDGTVHRTPSGLLTAIIELGRCKSVFFKDTTEYDYLPYLDPDVVAQIIHTFLVRTPAPAIASHIVVNPDMTLPEVGLEHAHQIFDRVRTATGRTPVVVDAEDLLRRPEETVRAYCAAVGLPYLPEALTWSPGGRDEWSRTDHWHRAVNASQGLGRSTTATTYRQTVDNDEQLAAFLAHHQPFYDLLSRHRLPIWKGPTSDQ